jgi:hypothetical protein
VPIFEAGEADGLLFIAMRHVEGTDLSGLLRREGPLDSERAVALVAQRRMRSTLRTRGGWCIGTSSRAMRLWRSKALGDTSTWRTSG